MPTGTTRWTHPATTITELWPGPAGYPEQASTQRLWLREALLRAVAPGELLAAWTTGGFCEPWAGNHTVLTRSTDDGRTWHPAGAFAHPTRGLFTTELFCPAPGEVHAFLQTYDNGVWMTQLHSYRAVSRDGGRTWDGPHSIPGGVANVWVNRGLVHAGGRWVIPVSWAELHGAEWAPPSVGRAPAPLRVGARETEPPAVPYGADTALHYRLGNAWADRNHRYCCGVLLSDDGGATFRLRGYLRGGKHGHLIEPRVVELSNGDLAMLIRSQRDGCLWRADSRDGGETWHEPQPTAIPNPAAKVNVLRATDGRVFLLHNPVGHDGAIMGGRNPLSLWVSEDDLASWSVQVDLVRDANPSVSLNYPDGYLDEAAGVLRFVWEDTQRVWLMSVPLDIA